MNINYKQPQFELFPASSATIEDVNKPRFLLANLTLSLESLVILTILVIMIGLFAFSLGVERGKHLAAQALDERVGAAWNLMPHKPVMPVPVAATTALGKPVAVVTKPIAVVSTAKQNASASMPLVVKPNVIPAVNLHFTLQVASYKSEAFAKQHALSLKAKGLPSFLIKKGDFWLLCVGQFSSKENASNFAKRIQSKHKGLSVRRF